MSRRTTLFFIASTTLTCALVAASSMTGCQTGTGTGTGATGGTGGEGASASTSTTGSMSTSTGSGTSSTSTGTTSSSGGTGGAAPTVTIQDITTGVIGPKVPVSVKGVVAMSQKFLVSKSNSTGSCLWGIYVSAPGLTETAANTGVLVVSYGTPASIADGGTKAFCPIVGQAPCGDGIPDDVAIGDVLDIAGKTDKFLSTSCTKPTDASVGQIQISNVLPNGAVKTGTATPPTPHLLSDAEITQLASPSDTDFHDKWAGVKVRIANVTSTPQSGADGGTGITDQYGHIVLMGSGLYVGDKNYYQGLLAQTDICHKGPVYANTATTFTRIDGFSYLDFCTWSLEPDNRCLDFAPPSDDCAGNTCQ